VAATRGYGRGMASMTPLGAVIRGLVAGAVGTLAMGTPCCTSGYRRGGGKEGFGRWELAKDLSAHLLYGTTTAVVFRALSR
jgi:hypothetical protein